MQRFVAAALVLMAPNAAAWAAEPEALQIFGQAGLLGEWELTANVAASGAQKQFFGPLIMKHVGLCTVDGPEQKTGEIQLQLLGRHVSKRRYLSMALRVRTRDESPTPTAAAALS